MTEEITDIQETETESAVIDGNEIVDGLDVEDKVDHESAFDTDPSIHPNQKNQTKKRIKGLIKNNVEKDKEIEDLRAKIERLTAIEETRSKKEHQSTVDLLKEERLKAIEDGDHKKFLELDDQYVHLLKQEPDPFNNMDQSTARSYFKSKNPWYGQNDEMTEYAEIISDRIFKDKKYSHLPDSQKLDLVAEKTKKVMGNKSNPYQASSPTEGAPLSQVKSGDQPTKTDIDGIMTMYGVGTKQEAMKIYKRLKGQ